MTPQLSPTAQVVTFIVIHSPSIVTSTFHCHHSLQKDYHHGQVGSMPCVELDPFFHGKLCQTHLEGVAESKYPEELKNIFVLEIQVGAKLEQSHSLDRENN